MTKVGHLKREKVVAVCRFPSEAVKKSAFRRGFHRAGGARLFTEAEADEEGQAQSALRRVFTVSE